MTFTPKPGERARLVSSPDKRDAEHVGKVLQVRRVEAETPAIHWICDDDSKWIHRDAVWDAVAAQPKPAPLRQRHDIPWSQPLPLEPRTLADDPLPVKPASEPGDGALENLYAEWPGGHVAALRSIYRAGLERDRAAHAAEVERLTRDHEKDFQAFTDSLPPWEGIASQRATEIESLRSELALAKTANEAFANRHEALLAEVERLRGELTAEKRAHEKTRRDWEETADEIQAELNETSAQLAEARARPVPSDEALLSVWNRHWKDRGFTPADAVAMLREVALFSPEPRGIPGTLGHTDKTPKPAEDPLAGMPTALRDELKRLERQGFANRQLIYLVTGPDRWLEVRPEWERIEREEKGGG